MDIVKNSFFYNTGYITCTWGGEGSASGCLIFFTLLFARLLPVSSLVVSFTNSSYNTICQNNYKNFVLYFGHQSWAPYPVHLIISLCSKFTLSDCMFQGWTVGGSRVSKPHSISKERKGICSMDVGTQQLGLLCHPVFHF